LPGPSDDLVAPSAQRDIDRQLPVGDEIFLDHLAHFVRDAEAARRAFARCGFAPTPVSIQVSPNPEGGVSPTGTGNVTAMFSRGYIEVLFKTSDTPLSREFDAALVRHAGLHLAAFAVADERLGEKVCLSVIFRDGAAAEPGELLAHLSETGLSRYDMPEYFIAMTEYPLTASGKILKRELVEWAKSGHIQPIPVRWTDPARQQE